MHNSHNDLDLITLNVDGINMSDAYSKKVVLGMIAQCHSETDIVNCILPYMRGNQ